jgi:MFS family permease
MTQRRHREELGGALENGEKDDKAGAHGARAYQPVARLSGSPRPDSDDERVEERELDAAPLIAAAVPAVTPTAAPIPPLRRWPPPSLAVRPFRWYWIAQWPTLLGTWMQVVALGFLVYDLTHSTVAVAAVSAADGLPAVFLSLGGGLLADRLPRRRILLVTQSVLGISSGVLAVLALTGHAGFWSIVAVAVVYGSADALDLPTRQAMVADLVDRDLIVNAVALSSTAMSATRIIGPSLAGLLIATAGPGACFAVLAVAYMAPLAVLLTVIPDVKPLPRAAGATALGELFEGVRLVRRDPLVRGIVIVCATLAFLGVSYMPYLPVLARTQLHGGPAVLGLLYSIGGVGGVVGGVVIATVGNTTGRRRLLIVGGLVYAVSLFAVAHSAVLWLTLVALVGISFAFLAMNTSMTTLLQTDADPRLRGRLLGIYAMLFAGLQPLGTVLYSLVGSVVGLFNAIGVGAVVVGVVAVAVAISPGFRSRFTAAPREPSRGVSGAD